jgi:hypothetical protein|tara:strand:- start:881 stop:1102 length:222 start_codon:yes stop_codon:yes gene_type:complete
MDDMSDQMKTPLGAAMTAAAMTAGYIYVKHKINNEPMPEVNAYAKPAALNAIMVYFIVSNGIGGRERISSEPY